MKITIDIDEKLYEEIMRISKELKTQDNRGTADPYYYTICNQQKIPTSERYSYDGSGYLDQEGCSVGDLSKKEDFISYLKETLGYDGKELEEYIEKYEQLESYELEEFLEDEFDVYYQYWFINDYYNNVFLTESAAKQYIKNDRHNLEGNNIHDYVEYARKNKELLSVIKLLKSFTKD